MRYLSFFSDKLSIKSIFIYSLGASLCFLAACNSGNGGEEPNPDPIATPVPVPKDTVAYIKTKGAPIFVVVRTQTAIIRDKPNIEGSEIARLAQGDSLIYDNKLSDYTTEMRLEGVDYDEHWLHVRFDDNKEGWVYGGNVVFEGLSNQALAELVYDKRLRKFFSNGVADKVNAYKQQYENMQTIIAFRTAWRQGEELRVTLESSIEQTIDFLPTDVLPDFFWLNDVFPAYVVAYPPTENRYCLFKNYAYLSEKAAMTTGTEDDELMNIYLKLYPQDSIEYLYKEWVYDLGEKGMCSRLGGGIHYDILATMDTVWQKSDFFHEELEGIKQDVLEDITTVNQYWLAEDIILTELDSIINQQFSFMTEGDRIALSTRRNMIAEHQNYDIIVNMYAGGE